MPLDLARELPRIPAEPGVYLFRDGEGRVLYVGKAASLRSRLTSYRDAPEDPRKERMLELAASVEVVLAGSEKEALLLEASLVRRHRPRFNVRLTDDKRYPYLRISGGKWPRVTLSRDTRDPDSTYFGPFPDASAARRTLEVLREAFKIRNCRELIPGGCLAFQMRLCWAPCVTDPARRVAAVGEGPLAGADVPVEYHRAVEEARRFLRGNADALLARLAGEMEASAGREDFERAARLRDRIRAIEETLGRQAAEAGERDRDVFAVAREAGSAVGFLVLVRGGRVAGEERFTFRHVPAEAADADLLSQFVRRYYEDMPVVPPEVVLSEPVPEDAAIAAWLGERRGRPVRILAGKRGDAALQLELARRNAAFHLAQERLRRGEADGRSEMADLARHLGLPEPPRRVECVDVSHLGGKEVVASLAVLEDGRPRRAHYRRFRLKAQRNDDPAAIAEVVGRRLRHADWPLPGLLLVDGGPTQLAAAWEAAAGRVPLASLAKREEEVFAPSGSGIRRVPIPRDAPGLLALMRVRDEAHRFALAYQQKRRALTLADGSVPEVPGLGAARKRALLARFGTPEAMRKASEEDLARVPGIGPKLARRLRAALQGG